MQRRLPNPKELAPLLHLERVDLNGTRRRLAKAQSIPDLRRIAQRRTPSGPFHYVDGAADDEITLRKARQYFHDVEFQPAILRDVRSTDTSTTLFGERYRLPFGCAPTGFTRMMHAEGERAVVRATGRAGIPYALSTMSTTSIQDLQTEAPDAAKMFQLYLWKDHDRSRELMALAQQNGYKALILTVDVPVTGNRMRDARYGMTIPPQLNLRTFLDASYRPHWWFDFLTTEPLRFAFAHSESASLGEVMSRLVDPGATIDDLAWMIEAWDGPVIVKGIQTVEDAVKVTEAGADGIILSNHGGRQLDRAPLPLRLVPQVRGELGDDATIMLDTGIMSGADIVAAIAAGADFAWVGRAYLYGLMAGGEAGVARALKILETEVLRTMQLLGVRSVAELGPHLVRLPD